jgi:hypothetical protein
MYLKDVSVPRAEIHDEGLCIDDENNGYDCRLPVPQTTSAVTQTKRRGYMKRYIAESKREYPRKNVRTVN